MNHTVELIDGVTGTKLKVDKDDTVVPYSMKNLKVVDTGVEGLILVSTFM